MKLSPSPDLSSNGNLVLTALAVTLIACIGLVWHSSNPGTTLGDTDDAMRLVLVRDLMSGRGWYDQLITRLQPPVGTYMHWSRLLDGALAGTMRMAGLIMSPASAELATRFFWPLLWIFPTVLCALTIALRLGGPPALFICAIMLASNQQPFVEFMPGRIDHHNIQIAMTVIAMACAVARNHRSTWAVLCGAATGLGLALGVEALPFHTLIAASYALRAATGHDDARTTRSYAISLLATTLVLLLRADTALALGHAALRRHRREPCHGNRHRHGRPGDPDLRQATGVKDSPHRNPVSGWAGCSRVSGIRSRLHPGARWHRSIRGCGRSGSTWLTN